MEEDFHLDIFPGDFYLPSLDRECLFTLAYCRFNNIPIKVHYYSNLYLSKVPRLKTRTHTIIGADSIIDYFENRKNIVPNNDSTLSSSSLTKLDLWSYKALITKKLEPCLLYFWWYDQNNYNDFLSGWYSKRLPFPTNFFIPRSLRKDAVAKLEAQFSNKVIESDFKVKTIENSVINEARYCLNLLIEKLGDQNFFFGNHPTPLDASVFSYLALLYKVPTKNSVIQNHINISDPLRNYVDRVLKIYFGKDFFNSTSQCSFDNNNSSSNEDSSFADISWTKVLYSGAIAGFFMLFYAVSTGILTIKNTTEYNDGEDQYDEEREVEDKFHNYDQE